MMKPLTSLINIRFAVGATLAISAALAVVLSLTLSSDETASGAKHPNHEAVSNAVATLEAEQSPHADDIGIDAAVVTRGRNGSNRTERSATDTASIVPTVTIADDNAAPGAAATAQVTISTALGADDHVDGYRDKLEDVRGTETTELTNTSDGVPANFTALAAATVTIGSTNTSLTRRGEGLACS